MSNTQQQVVSHGFPTFSILTIIFVLAKMFNLISWSWWLVLLPLWGPLVLFLAILAGILFFAILVALLS